MTGWIVAALAWPVASLFVGLWWGERSRRIDAQKVAERRPLVPRQPARVRSSFAPSEELEGEAEVPGVDPQPLFDQETQDRMTRHFMSEHDVDEGTAREAVEETLMKLGGATGLR